MFQNIAPEWLKWIVFLIVCVGWPAWHLFALFVHHFS